ncbi:MAG TPA: Gfo/Idh/MocA family oxidoreductase [Anaerolinea sp.]|nr:Gfo/Idh/MocA family oxidoreductase [Anaerolinea sp.]
MNEIRWGLLSTARINRRLIPSIRMSARSRLVGVASRNLETARQYAADWEIPQVFGSYDEMLASDQIDVVYISLPNGLHAEWSIRAMRAGKHVLCEKPFAMNLAEVDQMIAASKATGKVLAEAFMYRHHPQTQLVMEWMRAGRLGRILNVNGTFSFKLDRPGDVRLIKEQGGGSLYDVGVYPLSYAQAVFGAPPTRVFGSADMGPTGVDRSFSAHMQYAPGQTATFFCSFDVPFHTQVEIRGTTGRIVIARPFSAIDEVTGFTYFQGDENGVEVPFPPKDLYLGEVEDMELAILDGKPTEVSLEQTRNHMRTVDALLKSAQTGLPQHLPA